MHQSYTYVYAAVDCLQAYDSPVLDVDWSLWASGSDTDEFFLRSSDVTLTYDVCTSKIFYKIAL